MNVIESELLVTYQRMFTSTNVPLGFRILHSKITVEGSARYKLCKTKSNQLHFLLLCLQSTKGVWCTVIMKYEDVILEFLWHFANKTRVFPLSWRSCWTRWTKQWETLTSASASGPILLWLRHKSASPLWVIAENELGEHLFAWCRF